MLGYENHGNDSLRARLKNGESVFGVFVTEFQTPSWGPILDTVGYDFAIFDMEHGRFSLSDLASILPSFHGSRSSALLRVPAVRREYFQVPLDLGITGLVVPMIESADEARQAVDFMKYGPQGHRGISFGRPHTNFYSCLNRNEVVRNADANTFLVIQIETEKGVRHLEEILEVPGIDVVFVGNADLSQSLQCANDLHRDPLRNTMEFIIEGARKRNIVCGGNFVDHEAVERLGAKGVRFISLTTDVELMQCGMSTAWRSATNRDGICVSDPEHEVETL